MNNNNIEIKNNENNTEIINSENNMGINSKQTSEYNYSQVDLNINDKVEKAKEWPFVARFFSNSLSRV